MFDKPVTTMTCLQREDLHLFICCEKSPLHRNIEVMHANSIWFTHVHCSMLTVALNVMQ